jgi:hypothetical protein
VILKCGFDVFRCVNVDGWFAHGGGRNFNRNLKYLNLSGNKKSDLKRNNDGKRVLDEHGRVLSDFSRLSHLRALGLMDVMTTFLPNIPEDSDERRVRTSQTEVNGMSYGIANTVGRNGYLITVDLVPSLQRLGVLKLLPATIFCRNTCTTITPLSLPSSLLS